MNQSSLNVKAPIIPSDDPSIFAQLTTLDRTAIVRPNNPPAGIAGFLFDIDLDAFMELMSEITDNPVEDNTSLQDNIALMPEKVTLRGIVAELTDAGYEFPSAGQTQTTGLPGLPAFPMPSPVPFPLPLFPAMFPPFSLGANLSFTAKIGPVGLSAGVKLGVSGSGLNAAAALGGAIGPFSADSIVRSVSGELGGVLNGLSNSVQAAVSSAVQKTVQTISGGSAPSTGAISAAINKAVGNVIGPALSPSVTNLIGQSVNTSVSTTAGASPSPTAGAANSLYQYYLNRSQVNIGDTYQSLVVGYFYQMWRARQLFSVETPWGIMNNMAIQSVRPEQSEDTKDATNFSITFKKIRIAKSVTVNLGQLAGRNAFQAAASVPAQNGIAGQTPAAPAQVESWLRTIVGRVTGGP